MNQVIERIEQLKKVYEHLAASYFTDDCEHVTQIDFETCTVYYYVSVTAACGCCGEFEDREMDLETFMFHMTDEGFKSMIEHYTDEQRRENYRMNAE